MKDDLRGSQKLSKIKSKTEERVQISTEEAKSKEKQHDLKTKVTSKHGNFTLNEKAAIWNLDHIENEDQKGQVYSEILE